MERGEPRPLTPATDDSTLTDVERCVSQCQVQLEDDIVSITARFVARSIITMYVTARGVEAD